MARIGNLCIVLRANVTEYSEPLIGFPSCILPCYGYTLAVVPIVYKTRGFSTIDMIDRARSEVTGRDSGYG